MKKLSILLLFSLSFFIFGQDYQPFSQNVSKRFQKSSDLEEADYFFHSLAELTNGDTLSLKQYHTSQPDNFGLYPQGCPSWGGTSGAKLDTTWLGNLIQYNTLSKELILENQSGTPLTFDFGISIGDSSMFFSDGSLNYYIVHQGISLSNIYSVMDSIKHFEIRPYDNAGNLYSSNLEGFEIRLSKNHGIISFIDCFEFPIIQEAFVLYGQTNPLLGTYQLTYDQAYPWNTGDEIQYYCVANHQIGGTGIKYSTLNITNRTETADSVRIDFIQSTVNGPSPPQIPGFQPTFFSPIEFKKNTVIFEQPHNILPEIEAQVVRLGESEGVHCYPRSQMYSREGSDYYCDSCFCCLSFDGNQTENTKLTYSEGLGLSKIEILPYGFPLFGTPRYAEVNYSKVNGVECGTKWTSIDEHEKLAMIEIYPNPSNGSFSIEASTLIESCIILGSDGRYIYSNSFSGTKNIDLHLSDITAGIYIICIDLGDSIKVYKKILIQ